MISYSDSMLGELLEALDKSGGSRDTAVFLFSDHGEWGGDYGLVEKWPSACDGVLEHVPLIAHVPGMAKGHEFAEIVELYDVMATCLELAGIQAQHTHFARSLMPQLRDNPAIRGAPHSAKGATTVMSLKTSNDARFQHACEYLLPESEAAKRSSRTISRATSIRTVDLKMVLRPDGVNICTIYGRSA